MTKEERTKLSDLKEDVADILSLDNEYLTQKMRDEPEEIIATLRAAFYMLHTILDQALKADDE